jgi:hypothetical protein
MRASFCADRDAMLDVVDSTAELGATCSSRSGVLAMLLAASVSIPFNLV